MARSVGLWQVLQSPVPAWPSGAPAATWRALGWAVDRVIQPLSWRGRRPPVATTLVWNVVWVAGYAALLGGGLWWELRTNEHGERVRSVEEVQARLIDAQNEYGRRMYKDLPDNRMPVPTRQPAATLMAMMASRNVDLAFYLARDRHTMLIAQRQTFSSAAARPVVVGVDLKGWRPALAAWGVATRGPWTDRYKRLRRYQRQRDQFLLDFYNVGLGAGLLQRPDLDHGFTAHAITSEDEYLHLKGNVATGWIGYRYTNGRIDNEVYADLLRARGLEDALTPYYRSTAAHTYLAPGPGVPRWMGVYVSDTSAIDRALDAQVMPWLLLVALLGLARLVGAVRDLRAFWNERALALGQSNFVSAVSHEMRTPLTTIQLYADMLEQEIVQDPDRRRHYLATIAGEGQRLGRLVENVLDHARITGQRKAYHFEDLDLRDVLAEARAAVAGPAERAGMTVEVHAPVAVAAHADRDALVQALVNLASNAIKYAGEGKLVVLSAEPRKGGAQLAVLDHGPGIVAAEQAKVFEPFYRIGDELTRTVPGTGLGLALVREVAKAHGGRVDLHSPPGQGCTFRIVLPSKESEHLMGVPPRAPEASGALRFDPGAKVPVAIGAALMLALVASPFVVTALVVTPRLDAAVQAGDRVAAEVKQREITLKQLKQIADRKEALRAELQHLMAAERPKQGGRP